ncbi:HNH endonuclease [Nostoc flagelliforme FACHB-838]|uniref:HNH endonuclease n=1 Tax=Nostoc flagelliforme FACHB-838 TaxID=2692904 RepID=A0ABR8E2S9_9NOSO|nr:HNH endonuclease [Nostoc flagelliforme]MBD2534870.1 HNH endonuclease [Nostoc flagelliforme FACHB-838]
MPQKSQSRYPENWPDIALEVKQSVDWRCSKCQLQCIRPGDDTSELSRSLRTALTLTVHHKNFLPEDNRRENLYALCTACHLSFHTRRRGNVSPGQLSLF